MKRIIPVIFSIILVFSLSFCATAPEEEAEEEEVVEEVEEEEPEEVAEEEPEPEPVSDEAFQNAKSALEEAEWAGAETHAEEHYNEALSAYEEAQNIRESDPEKARSLLASCTKNANEAFEKSVEAQYTRFVDQFEEKAERLLSINAHKYRPERSQKLYDRYNAIEDLYNNENYKEAFQDTQALLDDLDQFYEDVSGQIRTAENEKRAVKRILDESEEEAEEWALLHYEKAERLYIEGNTEFDKFNLDEAIASYRRAKQAANAAGELAAERREMFNTYMKQFTNYYERLKGLGSDKFRPEKSEQLYRGYIATRQLVEQGDYGTAKARADILLQEIRSFYEDLDERVRWANILKRDANRNKDYADDADAEKWSPEEYRTAKKYFEQGQEAYNDYELEKSIENFDKAKYYYLTAARLAPDREQEYKQYLVRLERLQEKLREINADKFRPERTDTLLSRARNARELYAKGEYLEAKEEAGRLAEDLQSFYNELYEQVQYARSLRRNTEQTMDKAEEVEAYIWSTQELQKAAVLYADGLGEYRDFDLEQSIELLKEAKNLAQKAVRLAPRRKAAHETEALMDEAKEQIREASELTIMTEEGEIILPEEEEEEGPGSDSTSDASDSNDGPRSSFSAPADIDYGHPSAPELSELRDVSLPFSVPSDLVDALVRAYRSKYGTPVDGATVLVLGDESRFTLLQQARELYEKGMEARETGEYEKAKSYFQEAGRLAAEYKSLAIGEAKSVAIDESNCLWCLASQEYNNPLLWPLIWVLNMNKIEDPDLIYPGWKIFIPVR